MWLLPAVVVVLVRGVEDVVVVRPKVDEDGDRVGDAGANRVADDAVDDLFGGGPVIRVE